VVLCFHKRISEEKWCLSAVTLDLKPMLFADGLHCRSQGDLRFPASELCELIMLTRTSLAKQRGHSSSKALGSEWTGGKRVRPRERGQHYSKIHNGVP
jgi:hypothetical protein